MQIANNKLLYDAIAAGATHTALLLPQLYGMLGHAKVSSRLRQQTFTIHFLAW
jgi:hypothetical protein